VSHEDRFVDIEIKLAQQEDLLESLNAIVYQQGRRIDGLEETIQNLIEHIRTSAQNGQSPLNDKPPHY